jgi:drug/metabolite transporter (DMT)-like permease
MAQLAPAIIGASSFAFADVMTKLTLQSGADVLTLALFRGVVGLPLLTAWLFVGARAKPLSGREKWVSLGIGVLFAGTVYWLFKAIEIVTVPVAILTYFVYPLLTGLAAAVTGLERLGLRGAVAAFAAFLGLALMIGAHPGGVALAGIAFGLAAACSRVITLLLTRAKLAGADSRLISWYSILSATVVFALIALATGNWQPPQTPLGWCALTGGSVGMTIVVLAGVHVDPENWGVSDGVVHEPGAAARHHRQRRRARRGDYPAASHWRRWHDRGAGGVPAAALNAAARMELFAAAAVSHA